MAPVVCEHVRNVLVFSDEFPAGLILPNFQRRIPTDLQLSLLSFCFYE